jgi:hypothetical protein
VPPKRVAACHQKEWQRATKKSGSVPPKRVAACHQTFKEKKKKSHTWAPLTSFGLPPSPLQHLFSIAALFSLAFYVVFPPFFPFSSVFSFSFLQTIIVSFLLIFLPLILLCLLLSCYSFFLVVLSSNHPALPSPILSFLFLLLLFPFILLFLLLCCYSFFLFGLSSFYLVIYSPLFLILLPCCSLIHSSWHSLSSLFIPSSLLFFIPFILHFILLSLYSSFSVAFYSFHPSPLFLFLFPCCSLFNSSCNFSSLLIPFCSLFFIPFILLFFLLSSYSFLLVVLYSVHLAILSPLFLFLLPCCAFFLSSCY